MEELNVGVINIMQNARQQKGLVHTIGSVSPHNNVSYYYIVFLRMEPQ